MIPSACASAARSTKPVGTWRASPPAATGMATTARILEAACDERRIEHRDGADEESGAEDVKHVGDRERIGGVAGEMAEARVLQGAQRLGVDVHHQRSSKVLPATEMRSARISRPTRVDVALGAQAFRP